MRVIRLPKYVTLEWDEWQKLQKNAKSFELMEIHRVNSAEKIEALYELYYAAREIEKELLECIPEETTSPAQERWFGAVSQLEYLLR